jgi:abortive infection bacteriophage resistance protein
MSKPFTSIEDQIEILINRNMVFDDFERAKSFLMYNNYYNVVNCFSRFFIEDIKTGKFKEGTNFDEIIAIHNFDREIKMVLFNKILDVEMHLKSISSLIFTSVHQEPFDYLIASNYSDSDILEVTTIVSTFTRTINKLKSKNNPSITHYLNKHKQIPLWVLINHFDFGQVQKFIKIMNMREQNKIAIQLNQLLKTNLPNENPIFTIEEMLTSIDVIRDLRNVLAHNNKLIDFESVKNLKYNEKLHQKFGITQTEPKRTVYQILIILQAYLNYGQYSLLHNTLLKRIKTLNTKLNTISTNEIISTYGFPKDWHLNVDKIDQNAL